MRRDHSLSRRFARSLVLLPLLGAMPLLSGCESQARQDPIYVRNSTDELTFKDIAFFRDRPLDDSIRSSLELADYAKGLELTGLITTLQRPGPFTVFAIPNPPLEQLRARDPQVLSPSRLPNLKRTLSYTIVPGDYTDAKLRQLIAKQRGPIGLKTLYGDVIGVSVEPATNQLILSDPSGAQSRIWLSSMPQSNGVLYITQSMLNPSPTIQRAR
ncbi:fasciclin domain-containing protein [Acetobacteraceae bacterium KSS8]|uniref:Fasciclin domain-containing protein n=1 Tax=Endosaccharibacter trunci TaxID=2812733 RepID=A0ABT1W828_9PROT|nr:fasciclin domain-containing protein [Acetobacteraceae bacterium KSS8]